jgi:hypothetical protein
MAMLSLGQTGRPTHLQEADMEACGLFYQRGR